MEFDNYSRTEALEKLFSLWKPKKQTEGVPLEDALGRISAEDLRSRFTLPVFRSSAGDGIAVRSADFAQGAPDTAGWRLGKDYVRADTGDDFDDRFDTVIMIEAVSFTGDGGLRLASGTEVKPGMNVNGRGSAIEEGELILEKGLPIRACDLGALARGGLWEVPVLRVPRVAFIPTGNELIPLGQVPGRGDNIDTNSIMAKQMFREMGAEPMLYPIRKDEPAQLESVLSEALKTADLVILNGGSSKGAEDYNAALLAKMGTLICHGVLAAPGRPLCLALIDNKPVVNLPGPMLAAYYGLDWCVRGIICHALGIPVPIRTKVKAVLSADVAGGRFFPEGFEFFCRIILTRTESGGYEAWPVSFDHVEGKRTMGFHPGHCTVKGPGVFTRGSEVDVELLYGQEYFL
ncbi:molybdenum cofactor synthesis domain protein [Treponema primitia ZAS-2]|uniref:Molybdopterin molybdenumtransferase n=1 Tax=Treponema primitia (strain ATCC BAA-887 / DSM 12427 / ZAS-2) TaxID=545694 RepID=F5YMZ8_TREPZ|nr:molybdopterin-binding protein [Treponema primitia]AEF84473.1 molybdenum cofactor synthesis domain protein [Treponema primitia ZAS-2]